MSDLFADAARERMHEVAPLALRLRPRSPSTLRIAWYSQGESASSISSWAIT